MNRILLVILSILSIPTLNAQIQLGLDIDGEAAGDNSGHSVSMPDANTIAIGARFNDGSGANAGHVKIYTYTGSSWIQKGLDLDGEAADDRFGHSVSMPDANTVAIGGYENDGSGTDAGHVRVYEWSGTAWIQKGVDINGEFTGDRSGWSVSMPDANTVAIGAFNNSGDIGSAAGHVRIYVWTGSNWIQKGADINGEASDDWSGYAISMPDANTIAIGAPYNNGTGIDAGHVRIYYWTGSSWAQKGTDINGEATNDFSGSTVSMPDANTVAIGARLNDGFAGEAGHVRIYNWTGSAWVQKGADIDGSASTDYSGFSVSMPDANTVAIGATLNDAGGGNAGQTKVFSWSGSAWMQKGTSINGEAAGDNAGGSVSMPDANTVAIGAVSNSGSASLAGHARIYTFCNTSAPTGSTPQSFCNSATVADLTATGTSVQWYAASSGGSPLSSGTILTNGATYYASQTISGCESSSRLAVTVTINTTSTPTGSTTQTFCNTATIADLTATGTSIQWYTASSGGSTLSSGTALTNGTTYYATQTISGCESATRLAVTVTINAPSTPTGSTTQTFCNSGTIADLTATGTSIQWYTASSGGSTLSSGTALTNGTTYYATQTISGCESSSRLAVTVTINAPSTPTGSATQTFCNSATVADLIATGTSIQWYTAASGGSALSSGTALTNGTTYYASQTISACESTTRLAVTVSINSTTSSSLTTTSCNNFTWAANGSTYTSSGTYIHTLTNSVGCDSLLTLNLTILSSSTSLQTASSCNNYTWSVNGSTYSASGTYTHTLTNSVGCDSVITLNLTILAPSTSSQAISSCDNYTWPVNGSTYSASGTYTHTLTNSVGCDSIITLNLTISTTPTPNLTQTGFTLTCTNTGVTYQWFNCDSNTPVSGATSSSFTPSSNGNYAVILTNGACSDTSTCTLVTGIGMSDVLSLASDVYFYPNPTNGELYLETKLAYKSATIDLLSVDGKLLNTYHFINEEKIKLNILAPSGFYFIKVTLDNIKNTYTIIKQ